MAVVLDASVLVVLASGDPRKAIAQTLMQGWIDAAEELHAPALLPYEVANSLTRLITAGTFPEERLDEALRAVEAIPVTYHPLEGDADVIRIALRLGRRSAYDAAYLALAERLGAQLWTFDGPLFRNATGIGFPVHLAK